MTFFDSYGFSADTYGIDGYINQNVTRYNDKPFQGLTSDTCGDYLFYLLHQARNVDMHTIQAIFKQLDTQWNDAQVATFVHSCVKKSLTSIRHNLPFSQCQQTCKPLKYCRNESINHCLK